SDAAYTWQMTHTLPGSAGVDGRSTNYRGRVPPESIRDRTEVSKGWIEYTKGMQALEAYASLHGIDRASDVFDGLQGVVTTELERQYPAWKAEFENYNLGEWTNNLDKLRLIASDPALKNDPLRPDIAALQNYLDL